MPRYVGRKPHAWWWDALAIVVLVVIVVGVLQLTGTVDLSPNGGAR
jgi:hypothetical protein